MILLAYSILKREKNALVYQYTDDKDVLKPLKMPTTNYEAAKKFCEENAVSEQSDEYVKICELFFKINFFCRCLERIKVCSYRWRLQRNRGKKLTFLW